MGEAGCGLPNQPGVKHMPLQKDYTKRVFHGLGQLCSGSIICLLMVPCRALKLPLFRQEGKKQSERRRKHRPLPLPPPHRQPLTRTLLLLIGAGIGSLVWQVTTGRVISEGAGFLPCLWSRDGEVPRGAALASTKRQPSP